jgi:dCTP deaminase
MTTFTDEEILNCIHENRLITDGFDVDRVKQACYELRASHIYYDLNDAHTRKEVEGDGTILLRPKQMVVFITMETLDLPSHVLGRVLSKGQLFSLGLVPVNTYADPGFQGKLGIVMINASNEYIAIPPETPIAKIEFVNLGRAVDRPYSGQHGYETEIWPIQTKFKLTAEQIKMDPRIGDPLTELRRSYGPDFGRVIDKVFGYGRTLMIVASVYFFVMLGVIALNFSLADRLNIWVTVGIGAASSLAFAGVTWIGTSLARRR